MPHCQPRRPHDIKSGRRLSMSHTYLENELVCYFQITLFFIC